MAGRDATITLKVSNTGDAGEMRVETGIYPRSVVEDWYNTKLLSISAEDYSVPNCPGSSSNVQTAAVTLQSGEVKTFTYTVFAAARSIYDSKAIEYEVAERRKAEEEQRRLQAEARKQEEERALMEAIEAEA